MTTQNIQLLAMCGIVVVVLLFLVEARRWHIMSSFVSKTSRILRIIIFILIESLLVMVFLWPLYNAKRSPVDMLIYWTIAFAICMSIFVIALFDVREVIKNAVDFRKKTFRDLRDNDRREK